MVPFPQVQMLALYLLDLSYLQDDNMKRFPVQFIFPHINIIKLAIAELLIFFITSFPEVICQ